MHHASSDPLISIIDDAFAFQGYVLEYAMPRQSEQVSPGQGDPRPVGKTWRHVRVTPSSDLV